MKPSASLHFPFKEDFENNCLKRAHTVEETIISAVRLYLVTKPGSRVGNMVGCFVPGLLYQLIPLKNLSGYAKQLQSDLTVQFQGVDFIGVTMDRQINNNHVDLIIKISFTVLNSEKITDMEVILPSLFSEQSISNINKGDI